MQAAFGARLELGLSAAAMCCGVDITQLRKYHREPSQAAEMPADCGARSVHFVGDGGTGAAQPPAGSCVEPSKYPGELWRYENDVFGCVAWVPCGCAGHRGWRPVNVKLGHKKKLQQKKTVALV